jgi:hypothetical protein
MGMLITLTGLSTIAKDEVIFLDAKQNVILIKCIYAQVSLHQGTALHFNVLLDPQADTLPLTTVLPDFFITFLLDIST